MRWQMDGWLKALIATACVVVLAGGGWFAWGEWSDAAAKRKISDSREAARKELFYLAGARDDDVARVNSFCTVVREQPEKFSDKDLTAHVARNCRALGY